MRYGLTGNMGCGKSTVSEFFREFEDVIVFDADVISKTILHDERYAPELKQLLGEQVFTNGKIDRQKVAQLVFNDDAALKKLENFIHPLLWQHIFRLEKDFKDVSFFIVDAALIYESNRTDIFDGIIVVTCPEKEQYNRLIYQRGLTKDEITKRLKKQLPSEEKVKRADFVIDTHCSLPVLRYKVQKLYDYLKGGANGGKNSGLPRYF